MPIVLIAEQPKDVRQRRIAVFDQGEERIAQDVLHPYAPRLAPDLLKGFEHSGGGKSDLVRTDFTEWVVSELGLTVRGIEVHQITRSLMRNASHQFLDKIAVRIDHGKAVAVLNILKRKCLQER